eukprot:COSAG02_NODE_46023_length_352_cov_0.869565_1_plen_80_part_01
MFRGYVHAIMLLVKPCPSKDCLSKYNFSLAKNASVLDKNSLVVVSLDSSRNPTTVLDVYHRFYPTCSAVPIVLPTSWPVW